MFWRGVLGYLPVNIVQGVVGVLTLVVFTRVLTPAEYGVYALAYSAMSLAHTAVFTWIQAAMARFYAAEEVSGGLPNHFVTLYRLWLALTGVMIALSTAILALWPLAAPLKLAIAVGLATTPVLSLLKLSQEHRRAAGRVQSAALIDIGITAGGFGVGVVMAFAGLGGAAPLGGLLAASAACLTWALGSEFAHMKGGRFDPALVRRYAAYGFPVALSLILSLVLATTDRILLGVYADQATVGVYHAGYSLANRTLDIMFIWFGMAAGPAAVRAFERGGEAALDEAAREQVSFLMLLTLPATIGLVLVAHPLAEVIVGPDLRDGAAIATRWIAFGAFFSGVTTYYFHTAFTLGRRTGLLFAAMAVPAALNVALNFALVPRYGLQGALWATTASYAVGLIASMLLGRRAVKLPLPWGALIGAALATAAMAVVVLLIPDFGGLLELVAKTAAGGATYALVVLTLDAGGARTLSVRLWHGLQSRLAG